MFETTTQFLCKQKVTLILHTPILWSKTNVEIPY